MSIFTPRRNHSDAAPPTPAPNTERWIDVRNPATGELVGRAEVATAESVAHVAERARSAQPRWAARPLRQRLAVLRRFHDLVHERSDELMDTLQAESGKARRDAIAEVTGGAPHADWPGACRWAR